MKKKVVFLKVSAFVTAHDHYCYSGWISQSANIISRKLWKIDRFSPHRSKDVPLHKLLILTTANKTRIQLLCKAQASHFRHRLKVLNGLVTSTLLALAECCGLAFLFCFIIFFFNLNLFKDFLQSLWSLAPSAYRICQRAACFKQVSLKYANKENKQTKTTTNQLIQLLKNKLHLYFWIWLHLAANFCILPGERLF